MGRLILLLLLVIEIEIVTVSGYSRDDFASDFVFGGSTSANQVEGANYEDGRTPSILDTFTHKHGSSSGLNWNISCDQYHKYKEDVKLMAETGLEAYRFSISWSRLIPNGRGSVNPKAVEYYNNLINELLNHGIEPHVVLLHWDVPQVLWDDYGTRFSPKFVEDFERYADVCFKNFGDRVLHWTTFNEANYLPMNFCPVPPMDPSCYSLKGAYSNAHTLLLAHASVVNLYRTNYQEKQKGYIGINIFASWYTPEINRKEDIVATGRVRDFVIGWFMNPLVYGDYPEIMKNSVGSRFPSFTEKESKLVKGAFDFIAINCYGATIVKANSDTYIPGYYTDMMARMIDLDIGGEIVQRSLEYFKEEYGNPPIYIHENGYRMKRNASLNDMLRINYLNSSIGSLLNAVRNGSNAKGYFIWSVLDVLEFYDDSWSFGLYYIDLNDPDLKRYPKSSSYWYSAFLKENATFNPIQTRIAQPQTSIVVT